MHAEKAQHGKLVREPVALVEQQLGDAFRPRSAQAVYIIVGIYIVASGMQAAQKVRHCLFPRLRWKSDSKAVR